ncbi:hypothetical protein ACP4OV_016038 [Aristida adscensionis]
MHGETTKLSPAPAEDTMSVSKVLGDGDLLGEILLRLGSPTWLVRAALVSRRWLRAASGEAFLRRFRALHPPLLLGFYVSGESIPRPEFVPMPAPAPQPPEHATAVRRAACFALDAFDEYWASVLDCRNGRVLVDFSDSGRPTHWVLTPLRHAGHGMAAAVQPVLLPEPPCPPTRPEWPQEMFLPDDGGGGGGGASCYRVDVERAGRRVSAEVSVLRSGTWTVHAAAAAALDGAPPSSGLNSIPTVTLNTAGQPVYTTPWDSLPARTVLAGGGKVYVVTPGFVLVLDAATGRLFPVELPGGAAYEYHGNLVPSRGDGGALCLLHVKGDRLSVWWLPMADGGDGGGGGWVLRDAVSLRETCGHLVGAAEQGLGVASVVGVGDDAAFAFLQFDGAGAVVFLDLGRRRAEKVYQRFHGDDSAIYVHPFLMVWPPVFPVLIDDDDNGSSC